MYNGAMALLRQLASSLPFAVMALFLVGCGGVAPEPSAPATSVPSTIPSASPLRNPDTPSPLPPRSTPTVGARLVVSGSGTVGCYPYNGCQPVLVLGPAPARSLFRLDVGDVEVRFEAAPRSSSEWDLLGQVEGAPASVASGVWAVGIGAIESSDVGTCDSPCVSPFFPSVLDLRCVREFEVSDATQRVEIDAHFGTACEIGLDLQPKPPTTSDTPMPVPPWAPPNGGILDDCAYRPALLHVDADGRPWYEEIATGGRVDTLEFEGWQAARGDQARIFGPEGGEVREWQIANLSCVFGSAGVEWVDGPYEAWRPWDSALGEYPAAVARDILELERGHSGGAPIGAASLTSARFEHVDRQTLRNLDDEIRGRGDGNWSTVVPEFYLGDYASLANAIGTVSGMGFPSEDWIVLRDLQTDWRARKLRQFETPAGNTVSVLDETLLVWEDCSELIVPTITPGGVESGVESGIDEQGGIVTAYIYDPDGDDFTLVAVAYEDPTCRAHPVMGPIIDHLVASR